MAEENKAKIERSCGAVVFTLENGKVQYVIVQSKEGFYGFPKGHMEPGETEEATALREIREETGLKVGLLDGFRTEDAHPLIREGKPDTIKHIVYFLAQYASQTPIAQESELTGVYLMDYDTAMAVFQFESARRILTEANNWLMENQRIPTGEKV